MVDYHINSEGFVERLTDWGEVPPEKTGWHAFEWYARQQYGLEETHGHQDDGFDPVQAQGVEIKCTLRRNARGARGRFILNKDQHHAALEEERDYIFGLYQPITDTSWDFLTTTRMNSQDFHKLAGIDNRKWTREDEMGVRWTFVFNLDLRRRDDPDE